MTKYGQAYIAINVERELQLQDVTLADSSIGSPMHLFGMHMAFDQESSEKLHDLVTDFGWAIVKRELPGAYRRQEENLADEFALETCVDAAEHYGNLLLVKLTHMWLAQD